VIREKEDGIFKKKKTWKKYIAVDKSASFAAAGLFRRLRTIHQKGDETRRHEKREREGEDGGREEMRLCFFFGVFCEV